MGIYHHDLTVAATTVCAKQHDQVVMFSAQLLHLFPKCEVLSLALDHGFCLGLIVLGQLGLFS